MNSIIVLFTILFIATIGYVFIQGFGLLARKNTLLAIGLSYGVGIGLISFQLFMYARIGIAWQRELILVPWLLFFAFMFVHHRRNFLFHSPKSPRFSGVDFLLVVSIGISITYVIFEALIRPVTAWDGWATWLLESKIFFLDGTINPQIFTYLDSTYPLVIKMLGTFVYLMIGSVDDTAVLLTSVAFYLFTALLLFAVLQKRYGFRYALFFTFLLVTTQNVIRHGGRLEAGLADLPLGYYFFSCAILLLEYYERSRFKTLMLLCVLLGITQLIKVEANFFTILVVLLVVLRMVQQKLYHQMFILLFWFIPLVDWYLYRKMHGLQKNYFTVFTFGITASKSIDAIVGTLKELVNIKSWNFLWIIYFSLLFSLSARKRKEVALLHLLILSQLTIYVLIYIITVGSSPESSIERLLIHLAPLSFYAVALTIHPLLRLTDNHNA